MTTSSTTAKTRKPPQRNAGALAKWSAEKSMLFGDESPFSADVATGSAKLVVVTGENASGKSLYVRVMGSAFRTKEKGTAVNISIRERVGGGTNEMGRMAQVFMFGDEGEQSTGATSVSVVERGFSEDNLQREGGSLLILDEPELGLAESYSRALGEFIGQKSLTIPSKCRGVVVVTHSRPLVEGLLKGSGRKPTHVLISTEEGAKAGLDNWLENPEHRTVEQLLDLRNVGLDRWRQVNHLLGT